MRNTVLVIGAGGERGGAVVRALRERGIETLALRRRPSVEGDVQGDIADPSTLSPAFARADLIVNVAPVVAQGVDPRSASDHVLTAAIARGVPVVHHAGSVYAASGDQPMLQAAEAAKAAAWRESGLRVAILRPTLYLENLLQPWAIGAIGSGTLPYPLREETRVAWTSTRDLAEATADLVVNGFDGGEEKTVTGAEDLTGAELAARLSEGTGRPITYRYLPEDDFEAGLTPLFGAQGAKALADHYRHTNRRPTDNPMTLAAGDVRGGHASEWAATHLRPALG